MDPNVLWSRVIRVLLKCIEWYYSIRKQEHLMYRMVLLKSKVVCEEMIGEIGNAARTLFWNHKMVTDQPIDTFLNNSLSLE